MIGQRAHPCLQNISSSLPWLTLGGKLIVEAPSHINMGIQQNTLRAYGYEDFVQAQKQREHSSIGYYARWLNECSYLRDDDKWDLKHVMRDVKNREMTLISIDFEAYEHDNSKITEIGISLYDPWSQKGSIIPFIMLTHIVILENQHLRNGSYVPDHTDNFNGGRTLVMTLEEAANSILEVFSKYSFADQPIGNGFCLIGHAMKHDLNYLLQMGVSYGNCTSIDTAAVLNLTHGQQLPSLKDALRLVLQPFAFLHNAGNDAYYTLLLCLALADPFYRMAAEIDTDTKMANWKCRDLKGETINESQKFNGDEDRFSHFLHHQPL